MIIFKTDNFCDCRLCRGSCKIETPLDRRAFLAQMSRKYKTIKTGGRYPTLFTIPKNWETVNLSANDSWPERGDFLAGGRVVYTFPDSVHGCYKIRCHQGISIVIPLEDMEEVDSLGGLEGIEILATRK